MFSLVNSARQLIDISTKIEYCNRHGYRKVNKQQYTKAKNYYTEIFNCINDLLKPESCYSQLQPYIEQYAHNPSSLPENAFRLKEEFNPLPLDMAFFIDALTTVGINICEVTSAYFSLRDFINQRSGFEETIEKLKELIINAQNPISLVTQALVTNARRGSLYHTQEEYPKQGSSHSSTVKLQTPST